MCMVAFMEGGPLEGEHMEVHFPVRPYFRAQQLDDDGNVVGSVVYHYAGMVDFDTCIYKHFVADMDAEWRKTSSEEPSNLGYSE